MNRHENQILLDLRHIGINRIFVNRLSLCTNNASNIINDIVNRKQSLKFFFKYGFTTVWEYVSELKIYLDI